MPDDQGVQRLQHLGLYVYALCCTAMKSSSDVSLSVPSSLVMHYFKLFIILLILNCFYNGGSLPCYNVAGRPSADASATHLDISMSRIRSQINLYYLFKN